MAVASAQVGVANTATLIIQTTKNAVYATMRHRGINPIFIGGPTVTTSTGFQLNSGESYSIDLIAGDSLYGIVASGTDHLDLVYTAPS